MKTLVSLVAGFGILLGGAVVVASPDYADGDLAPRGIPDGIIDFADYLTATRIVAGQINPTSQEIGHGDLYPPGSPDGVINLQDLLLLQQRIEDGDVAYIEILDIFIDGPATVSGESGPDTASTTLVVGGFTGAGATVTNNPNLSDPEDASNKIWHFAASGGVANGYFASGDLSGDSVLDSGFDLSGNGQGQLVFDIKVNSISPGTTLTVKIDSGYPNLGEYTLTQADYTVGAWQRVAVDFATFLANPGPGAGLDLANVVNPFVIEVVGGSADVYLDNIFISHSCGQVDGCNATIKTKPYVPYTLVWSDEFDGTQLNLDNWSYETGYGSFGWGNDEWQLYTSSPNNVSVSGGNLAISARCDAYPACGKRDGTITSARINTLNKFEFKYGKIEARLKPPTGQGAWSAFWMLGANWPVVGWPNSGEIDIMEIWKSNAVAPSDSSTTHFTVHYCDDFVSNPCQYDPGWEFTGQSMSLAPINLGDDFHVFSAEWDSSGITGKIDGISYFYLPINPANMSEFLEEFFVILNVAVGGTLGGWPDGTTTWPQTMLVDYVRVYQVDGGEGTVTTGSPTGDQAALYSEGRRKFEYTQIVDSIIWSGNSTVTNTSSTAVAPYEGSEVLAATFSNSGKSFGGFIYDLGIGKDFSAYQTLKFVINTSEVSTLTDLVVQLENPGGGQPAPRVFLSNYTPTMSGSWAEYSIPLADLTGQAVALDLSNVLYVGFWNPQNASDQLIYGTLYMDDLHLDVNP